MRDTILRIYQRCPYPLRSVAAGLRGYSLRSWRYGPETEQLMQEAREREHWTSDKWKRWQEERLTYLLHHAATKVPYYRDQWTARRRRGDRSSWEYLDNWPILEKEHLRQNPLAFVAENCNVRNMLHDHTAGSTGTPLDIWLSKKTVRAWFAMFEERARHWNEVGRNENWATLGGQLIVPPDTTSPPFWVWNRPMKQLYLSANHISMQNAPAYINALSNHSVTHMVTYPSAAAILSEAALKFGMRPEKLRVVITIAEPLFQWQREKIKNGFGCEVKETYGMSEMVAAATECREGNMHLWPEVGRIEIHDDNQTKGSGQTGDLICTGLLNDDMPLIRYRIGDRGSLSHDDATCPCGRTLPIVSSLDGRIDDMLYSVDGRRFGRLDPVFKARLPICEAQIIQETINKVRVRYIPAQGYTPQAGESIVERLQARMGKVEVLLEEVKEIPRGPNGKFRGVICNLPEEEKTRLGM